MTEEFEISEELGALVELSEDAEKQLARIRTLQGKGRLKTNEELVGTIFPLLVEGLGALAQWGRAQEEILEDVVAELEDGEDGGGDSPFEPEDLAIMLDAMLVAISNLQTVSALDSAPEELKEMAAKKLPEFERVSKLLKAVLEDGQEEESEEDDDGEDDGEVSDSDSTES